MCKNSQKYNIFLLSLLVPAVFFGFGILTHGDWGETDDEKFDQNIGEFYYYNWGTRGYDGLVNTFGELQRNYGPLFDIIVVATSDLLHRRLKIVDDPVASYHVPTLISSTLLLWLIFWIGSSVGGWRVGLLSSVSLALMPRFIGDSQNNLKDMPVAFFFAIALIILVQAVERGSVLRWILAGILLGTTYCVKINALLILPIVALWWLITAEANPTVLSSSDENRKNPNDHPSSRALRCFRKWMEPRIRQLPWLLTCGVFCLLIAVFTIALLWPYYRYGTAEHFLETFRIFSKHEWNEPVLYLGQHIKGQEMPWHFPFVMLGVTTPIVMLVGALFGLLSLMWRRLRREESDLKKIVLFTLWLFIPPLTQGLSSAPMYDGIRHYLISLPALALLSGYGLERILFFALNASKIPKYSVIMVGLCSFTFLIFKIITIHPYEIVYFNVFTGGTRGAYGRFDLDYWGQSLKEAGNWLNENVPKGSLVWIPFGIHHFYVEANKISLTANPQSWPDYKVIIIRGMMKTLDPGDDYLNPKDKAIHAIKVDGADILRVFALKENAQLPSASKIPVSNLLQSSTVALTRTIYTDGTFHTVLKEAEAISQTALPCDRNEFTNILVALSYQGIFHTPHDGRYCFELYSDDHSRLMLNNYVVVKTPSMQKTRNDVELESGTYNFRVEYANTGGPACFEMKVAEGACADRALEMHEVEMYLE